MTRLLLASLDGLWFGLAILVITLALPRISPKAEAWLWRLVPIKLLLGLFGVGLVQWSITTGAAGGGVSGPGLLFWIWISGAGLMLARLAYEAVKVAQLRRESRDELGPDWKSDLREIAEEFRLRHEPQVRKRALCLQPMVVGSLRPVILVPERLADSEPEDRRALLAHECAHVAHRDLPLNWLYVASRVFFYFHPVLWLASSRGALAQERASDSAAVRAANLDRAGYAAWLLKMADSGRSGSQLSLAAGGSFGRLKQRIAGLGRVKHSKWTTGIAALVGLCALVPTTAFRASAASAQQQSISDTPVQTFEPVEAVTPVPPQQFSPAPKQTADGFSQIDLR